MASSVHLKALLRAAQICGGREMLRSRLRVSSRELERWISGEEELPAQVFLETVDIISEASLPGGASALRPACDRGLTTRAAALGGERTRPVPESVSLVEFLSARFEPDQGADMVEAALASAVSACGADMGNIQLACTDGLRIVAQRGFEQPFLDFFARVDDEASACGVAMKRGRPAIVDDVRSDPIFAGTPAGAVMEQAGARAVQSTPIVSSSGWVLGVLSTHYAKRHRPDTRALEAIDRIARRTAYWLEGGGA